MLCPNCRRLISGDVRQCPYCHINNPGARWRALGLGRILANPREVVRLVIYTNVAMYVISLLLSPGSLGLSSSLFGLLAPDNRSLLLLGATGTFPLLKLHRWWTLVAANYLHGSILHILFNMMALRQLAPLVGQEYGGSRLAAIYALSGVGGYAVSCLAGVPFTIGASASVCGLMGATLYFGKSRGGHYGQALYSQVGGWAVSLFVFGFIVPGINNWGHGGGMLTGALLGALLGYNSHETALHKTLASACLIGTALVLAWAVGTSVLR